MYINAEFIDSYIKIVFLALLSHSLDLVPK